MVQRYHVRLLNRVLRGVRALLFLEDVPLARRDLRVGARAAHFYDRRAGFRDRQRPQNMRPDVSVEWRVSRYERVMHPSQSRPERNQLAYDSQQIAGPAGHCRFRTRSARLALVGGVRILLRAFEKGAVAKSCWSA